jgi:hypothetical protein
MLELPRNWSKNDHTRRDKVKDITVKKEPLLSLTLRRVAFLYEHKGGGMVGLWLLLPTSQVL